LCHVPSFCCSRLHPSPVPNLPVCLYYWFHLCPVNSPYLVHLCLFLPCLDFSQLSLVICWLCVYSPCSRPVLSCVCLFMPCALLLLLFVSPPLTCSQSSPGLFVLLVSPVSC